MKISHYLEFESRITGGIRQSVAHQRQILDRLGISYTTAPSLDADVLHCNLAGPRSLWYARRARSRNIPVVMHTHVTAEDFGQSFRLSDILATPLRPYLRFAYGLADVLVCPSEYNQQVISEYTDVPTTVISNGVDREKLAGFETLRSEYKQRYELTTPTVFLVGHVIKRKGLVTFVNLARRLPDIDFVWFGPLDLELKDRETQQLIETAPSNCTFTGYIDDIRGAYAAGDIFLFPTHEENEGIALLEAMAAGKPVIVRNIPTFEWLDDGVDCLKVSSTADIDAFAAAVRELQDPTLRDELGTNAAARSDNFALETIAAQYQTLYHRLFTEVA